jgi:hypothetical protein
MAPAASIFGALLAWASRKNGKETREMMKELHGETMKTLGEISENSMVSHKETIESFKLIALLILAETPEEKKQIAKKILGEK